jgi:hypothetical protein
MEYLVAALLSLFAIGYAAVIAINIEKGRPWALEIAEAISMLDPQSAHQRLRGSLRDGTIPPPTTPEAAPRPELERLAA